MENPALAESIFWISAVLCAIGEMAIVRSAIVSSTSAESRALKGSSRTVEILWAVLPALAVAALLVATRRAMHHHGAP